MSIHWPKLHCMDLKELEQKRDKEITGFFWLGLQIAFIFGIPALVMVFIGKKLSAHLGNNNIITFCLVISFIFSWILVAIFYRKKSKRLGEIEQQIREIKNTQK